jgi:hypothetical protein
MNTPKMPSHQPRSALARVLAPFAPFAFAALAPLGLFVACQAAPDVTSAEVLTATACPSGYPCTKFANGVSLVTVEGCVADDVSHPRADLSVDFRLTAGSWIDPKPANASDSSVRVPVSARCARATFRTPLEPGSVHVQAQLADASGLLPYEQPIEIAIEPEPLDGLQLSSALGYLPAAAGTMTLTAQLFGKLGRPSNGTRVEFQIVSASPNAALPRLVPARADVSGGVDPTTLLVPDTAESITIRAIATPPAGVLASTPPAVTAQLTLTKQPLPASLSVLPATTDFGTITVGTVSATTTYTVTNALGAAAAGPLDFQLAGSGDFALETGGTCASGATLAGGTSCTLMVHYKPSSTGARSATLVITGAPGTSATATMSGTGI